jgi:ATP-binding cassette subfamily F protein 3
MCSHGVCGCINRVLVISISFHHGSRNQGPDPWYRPAHIRIFRRKPSRFISDAHFLVYAEIFKGYLSHAADQYSSNADPNIQSPLSEAADTISTLLVSASGDLSDENSASIRQLVDKFISKLAAANGIEAEKRQIPSSAKKLEHSIQVGAQRNISSTLGLAGTGVDLESANTRKVESRVDKKKLEKAERKIKAKQDAKVMKNVEYEASRLLDQPDEAQSYEEFFMLVNPLQLGSDQASKSKDIKVDGIDVSIGGKRILSDTSLTLAYGRRYGLVGQNGIGKSTLLRALSRREIAIPTHISILHVEQEVWQHPWLTLEFRLTPNRSLETILLPYRRYLMLMFGENICLESKKYCFPLPQLY